MLSPDFLFNFHAFWCSPGQSCGNFSHCKCFSTTLIIGEALHGDVLACMCYELLLHDKIIAEVNCHDDCMT